MGDEMPIKIPEAVGDGKNGFLINPENTSELAEKINKLIKNKKMREKMGKLSRKKVLENFDWDKNSIEIKKIYNKLIQKNG